MKTRKIVLTAFFTMLIVISAFVKIPMMPVPITLQTVAATLAGISLGGAWGCIAVFIYIVLGLVGFPVFQGGGGFSYILHPSFGFLIGFLASTYIIGKISEKKIKLNKVQITVYSYLSLIPMYIVGLLYYYFLMKIYIKDEPELLNMLFVCYIVFIPGDILKCILCGVVGERVRDITKD